MRKEDLVGLEGGKEDVDIIWGKSSEIQFENFFQVFENLSANPQKYLSIFFSKNFQ